MAAQVVGAGDIAMIVAIVGIALIIVAIVGIALIIVGVIVDWALHRKDE